MSFNQGRQAPILISDDDDDEIAFMGSSRPPIASSIHVDRQKETKPHKGLATVIVDSPSESEGEEEYLPRLGELFAYSNHSGIAIGDLAVEKSALKSRGDIIASSALDASEIACSSRQEVTSGVDYTTRKKRRSENSLEEDSQLMVLSKNASTRTTRIQELAKKEAEKNSKELAKAAMKAQKEAQKSFHKKLAYANRLRTTKQEAVREIQLYLSADMASPASPIAGALPEIRARFEKSLSRIIILPDDDSPLRGIIKIKRHVQAEWDDAAKRFSPVKEPYWEWDRTVLLFANAEEVVEKITRGAQHLHEWIRHMRSFLPLEHQLVLLIKGFGKYQNQTKSLVNREFTAAARAGLLDTATSCAGPSHSSGYRPDKRRIERELTELQLRSNTYIVHVERTEDIEDWVWNLCADIALRPYKLVAKSHLSFAAGEKSRKTCSVTDALELMLQEVQGITQSAASAIAAEYPSFANLMTAFERIEHKGGIDKGETLIADCEVANLRNGTASGRKLNKALARRVYNVLRGDDSLALA